MMNDCYVHILRHLFRSAGAKNFVFGMFLEYELGSFDESSRANCKYEYANLFFIQL